MHEQLQLLSEAFWQRGLVQAHDSIDQILQYMQTKTFEEALDKWLKTTQNYKKY